jgi:Ser/Thr protein kinase RdoA (MazF antagonist)
MTTEAVDADQRNQALVDACRQVGLDPARAELLRRGTNAVYRLRSAPVVVRVAPEHAEQSDIARQVAVARWLADNQVPVVRALDVGQPVLAQGHLVTFWESISDGGANDREQYGSTAELGRILRQLHGLSAPESIDLPKAQPVAKMDDALKRLDHLTPADQGFLAARVAAMVEQTARLEFVLPQGPIHGDANVGNLLKDRDGHAVLSDLDSFRTGPREYDLLQTAMFYDDFGWHTEAEYRDFVEAYGYDIRSWSGYPVLREGRELSMVLWVAGNAATDETAATELRRRLHSLRTGGSRRDWQPL